MSWLDRTFLELRQWEWIGIIFARLTVGLLFVLSGSGKLFRRDHRESMRKTLREGGIPFPGFNAFFVAAVEFGCGFLLLVGAATPVASLMLSAMMIVALATVQLRNIKSSNPIDWISEFFYLPEVLYLVILIWLFFAGPGRCSIDHLLFQD